MLVAFGIECANTAVDFPIYHHAGAQILHGDFDLYPQPIDASGTLPPHGFRYAPAIAFLFVPFALLPLKAGAFLFFALKVAAYFYVAIVLARLAGLPAGHRATMWMALIVVAGYTIEEFRYGNFHFFAVALMVLAFDAAESGAIATPAAALSIAIAAKVMPVLLLGYFAMRRRFALCAATVAALVILLALPAAVVGSARNTQLLERFAKYAAEKINEEDNYALRGVLVRYLTADHRQDRSYPATSFASLSPAAVSETWAIALVTVGLFVAAALWRDSTDPMIHLLELSIVLTVMLLASPHTQRRYFTALFVPVAALVAIAGKAERPRDRRLAVGALTVTAFVGTVLPLVFGGRSAALSYEAGSPYFFGTLLLFIVLLVLTTRAKQRAVSIDGDPVYRMPEEGR